MNKAWRPFIYGLIGALCLTVVQAAQAATLAYWRFHTDGGAPVTNGQLVTSSDDSSGNGYSLFPLSGGTATYAANDSGVFPSTIMGQANGFYLADNYNRLTNGTFSLNGDKAKTFTIEGYCRKTLADGSDYRTIVSFRNARTGSSDLWPPYFAVELGPDGQLGAGTGSQLEIVAGERISTTNANIQGNTTHHFAATVAPTPGNEFWSMDYCLYVDGVLLKSGSITYYAMDHTTTLTVGERYDGIQSFDGVIDEIRISDQTLIPSQFLNYVAPPPAGTVIKVR